jgi:hypothetical protein
MIHVVVTCKQAQGLEFKSYTAKKKKKGKKENTTKQKATHIIHFIIGKSRGENAQ